MKKPPVWVAAALLSWVAGVGLAFGLLYALGALLCPVQDPSHSIRFYEDGTSAPCYLEWRHEGACKYAYRGPSSPDCEAYEPFMELTCGRRLGHDGRHERDGSRWETVE